MQGLAQPLTIYHCLPAAHRTLDSPVAVEASEAILASHASSELTSLNISRALPTPRDTEAHSSQSGALTKAHRSNSRNRRPRRQSVHFLLANDEGPFAGRVSSMPRSEDRGSCGTAVSVDLHLELTRSSVVHSRRTSAAQSRRSTIAGTVEEEEEES